MSENEKCKCPLCSQQFTPTDGLSAEEHLAKAIVALYADMQVNSHDNETLPCPRCGRDDMEPILTENGVSKLAEIRICQKCSRHETVQDSSGMLSPITKWLVVTQIMGISKSHAKCADYIEEKDNPYPLCDNLGCVESHQCNISRHMDESGMYPGE